MQYERVQYVCFFAPCYDMVYATIAINCSKSFSCSARNFFGIAHVALNLEQMFSGRAAFLNCNILKHF